MVKLTHDRSLENLFKPHLIIICTILGLRKKTRIKVLSERYKLRFFKNLFFTFKSKYLCCDLQNKIIKTCVSRKAKVLEQKSFWTKNIFSGIWLPRLDKNINKALEHMAESKKKKKESI